MDTLTMCYRYYSQRYMKKPVDDCEKPAKNKRVGKSQRKDDNTIKHNKKK